MKNEHYRSAKSSRSGPPVFVVDFFFLISPLLSCFLTKILGDICRKPPSQGESKQTSLRKPRGRFTRVNRPFSCKWYYWCHRYRKDVVLTHSQRWTGVKCEQSWKTFVELTTFQMANTANRHTNAIARFLWIERRRHWNAYLSIDRRYQSYVMKSV